MYKISVFFVNYGCVDILMQFYCDDFWYYNGIDLKDG